MITGEGRGLVGTPVAEQEDLTVEAEIGEVFARAGVVGFLHARPVDHADIEVAVRADEPVVLASVSKITIALAYGRAVVAGRLDPRERVTVTQRYRIGGIGTAGCVDDVDVSLRDLAMLMLTQSDNAATDLVLERVGLDGVHQVLADLDLSSTTVDGGCEDLFRTMFDDLDVPWEAGVDGLVAALDAQGSAGLRALDPRRSLHRSTPRDITRQLSAIWTDQGSAPEACAIVRDIMADQVWTHRLMSGFPDDVAVAGKTGTLTGIRNEAGVVGFPDGRQYAVSVFLRTLRPHERQPLADAAIGLAARLAIESLRATEARTILGVDHGEDDGERA